MPTEWHACYGIDMSMKNLRKAAEMAVERLESHEYWMDEEAIKALRQALAQPEQRPVGTYEGVMETMLSLRKGTLEQQQIYTHMKDKLLYTAPPKREWVSLTDEDVKALPEWFPSHASSAVLPLVRAVQAKLKEKNR